MSKIPRKNKKNNDLVLEKLKNFNESKKINNHDNSSDKIKNSFSKKIKLFLNKNFTINEEYFEKLEEVFILSDLGAIYTNKIIEYLKNEVKINKISSSEEINKKIKKYFYDNFSSKKENDFLETTIENKPKVILFVGVNGSGKTTSIAKISKKFINKEKKVHLIAADTFRAGAVKQLEEWKKILNCTITTPIKENQDPGSVVFEGLNKGLENNSDVIIIDTAGRLENKDFLMNELFKIKKIILNITKKEPEEVILVLDSNIGQSALNQVEKFNGLVKLTGIFLSKMDSSSKGGVILSLDDCFKIPIKFIGFGEKIDDLEEFEIKKYLNTIISTIK